MEHCLKAHEKVAIWCWPLVLGRSQAIKSSRQIGERSFIWLEDKSITLNGVAIIHSLLFLPVTLLSRSHFSRIWRLRGPLVLPPWLVNSVGFTGENILRIMYAWINKVDEENSKEAGSRKKCKVRKKSGIRRREDVIVIWQRRWCRLQWAWQNVFFSQFTGHDLVLK